MNILLAIDGSAFTKKMLAYLATHGEMFSTKNNFHLLNVQPPLPVRVQKALGKAVVQSYYSEEAQKVLAPVVKFLLRHGIDASSSWKAGRPGEEIAAAAAAGKYDLLIMGSHGHGAVANVIMGSVATQVIANCETPVLLVR